jgi:hypothetical protein
VLRLGVRTRSDWLACALRNDEAVLRALGVVWLLPPDRVKEITRDDRGLVSRITERDVDPDQLSSVASPAAP